MNVPSQDSLLSMALFGSTQKSVSAGDAVYTESAERLHKPFEWKDAVCFEFCKGCGLTYEIDRTRANEYLKVLKLPPYKRSLAGYYFRVGHCSSCSSENDSIERVPLPQKP